MLKQCLLLSALGFVGLIAVSALAQNIMDPANAKFFNDAGVRERNQKCPCADHAPVCGCVRTSASSPEWYQNGHFDPAKRTKQLSKQLKLTANQQSQMLDTLESAKSQLEAMRSDRSLSRKVRNCKLALIRQASNDQISAFLETKQNAKLARIRSYKYNVDRSPVIWP
jgi:predicted GIY-YIG superfamily endonuclease